MILQEVLRLSNAQKQLTMHAANEGFALRDRITLFTTKRDALPPRPTVDIALTPTTCRRHIVRVSPLKIGNHVLAWLFARQLSRLIQGDCHIGFRGVPQLGIPAHNLDLLETKYDYIDQDSTYPWPKPENLGQTVIRRVTSSVVAKLAWKSAQLPATGRSNVYFRYRLSSNTPNLYPIRSASVGRNLLVDVASAVCNIGYLPSRCEASMLIPGDPRYKEVAKKFVSRKKDGPLYVHIRAGDILEAKNSLYKPLPIGTLKSVKEKLNTRLVFIGQLHDSVYSRELRQAFPDDEFFHSGSEGIDFEIIRAAPQILLSTSTFAWLAAWVSKTNHTVLLPNLGLFNPLEAPEINLIDSQDRRFIHLS